MLIYQFRKIYKYKLLIYYNGGTIMIQKDEKTYIQVSKYVRDKLLTMKVVPHDSYEDILRRLLKLEKRK